MLAGGAGNAQFASVVMPSTAASRSRTAAGSEPGFKDQADTDLIPAGLVVDLSDWQGRALGSVRARSNPSVRSGLLDDRLAGVEGRSPGGQ
jgi:hypothetical protein